MSNWYWGLCWILALYVAHLCAAPAIVYVAIVVGGLVLSAHLDSRDETAAIEQVARLFRED